MHVNIVDTPENLPAIQSLRGMARAQKLTLHVDPYKNPEYRYTAGERALLERVIQADRDPDRQLNYADFSARRCSAGRNYIVAAPNGDAFTCLAGYSYGAPLWSDMLRGRPLPAFAMGNLFDAGFRLNASDISCSVPCTQACDRDTVIFRHE